MSEIHVAELLLLLTILFVLSQFRASVLLSLCRRFIVAAKFAAVGDGLSVVATVLAGHSA